MSDSNESLDLGQRITHARTQDGLCQVQLAKAIGVTSSAISQCELGITKNLRMEHLFATAGTTGFEARWIATGQGPDQVCLDDLVDSLFESNGETSKPHLAALLRIPADRLKRAV